MEWGTTAVFGLCPSMGAVGELEAGPLTIHNAQELLEPEKGLIVALSISSCYDKNLRLDSLGTVEVYCSPLGAYEVTEGESRWDSLAVSSFRKCGEGNQHLSRSSVRAQPLCPSRYQRPSSECHHLGG
jgi:hypothetical protein